MAVQEILQLGNPLLLDKSHQVEDVSSDEILSVITDLDDTLRDFRKCNGFGRGIAAPQIGKLYRVLFVRMADDSFCGTLINPDIIWMDSRQKFLWDSCFSFPDLLVRVSRAKQIKVKYLDFKGVEQMIDADGDLAELLQHEIDHLDGTLAVHRAISADAFMIRAEWERQGRPE